MWCIGIWFYVCEYISNSPSERHYHSNYRSNSKILNAYESDSMHKVSKSTSNSNKCTAYESDAMYARIFPIQLQKRNYHSNYDSNSNILNAYECDSVYARTIPIILRNVLSIPSLRPIQICVMRRNLILTMVCMRLYSRCSFKT